MRIFTVSLVLSMGLLFIPAAIYAGCPCGEVSPQSFYSYSGPACFSPPGYCLAPGCCECPPCACDNAWAGYCEQKARWQAFWTQVGMPHPPRHGYGCGTVMPAGCNNAAPDSAPASQNPSPQPVAPAPATKPAKPLMPVPGLPPERSGRRVYFPWTR
jgi:hypothetical protein